MPSLDDSKRYQAREEEDFFDDGREIALLHFIYGKSDLEDIRGSPERVLAAIDEFARTQKYLMNVGEDKGRIVTDLIAQVKPQVMVELGGYVGYSTILFADAVRRAGGKTFLCLERNPEFAAVVASLVDLAGLRDVVQVVVGPSDTSIRRLSSTGLLKRIDLLFLDHYKPAYTPDLKLCEERGLIKQGTVLAADNVISPGNPPYLKYVRSTVEEKRRAIEAQRSSDGSESHFDDPTEHQYTKRHGLEEFDRHIVGIPDLIYKSELIHGFEPSGEDDGVEITRCEGYAQ